MSVLYWIPNVSMTDARGNITTYTYDSNGLVTEKKVGDSVYTYTYQNGLLSEMKDPTGTVTNYTHDVLWSKNHVTNSNRSGIELP